MTRILFHGGDVFDGTGAAPAPADVVVQDGRFVEVGSDLDGDVAVEVSGRTLLPGLMDCHVHVIVDHVDSVRHLAAPFSYKFYVAQSNLGRILDCGITTVRDAAGADLGIKQAVADGVIRGPRMFIALSLLSQTGGHGDGWMPSGACVRLLDGWPGMPHNLVDGPEEMRRKVRELVRAGADQIKLCSSGGVMSPRDNPHHAHFGMDELEVAVREAEAAGLYVMAHAQATQGIKNAVQAGIRSIEHGIFLDDETVAMMLERGTFLVPTLMAPLSVLQAADEGAAIQEASLEKARMVVASHAESFRLAAEAGVKVAMGTDAVGIPHGRNLEELELMVKHGLDATEALKAATSNAAELLRIDDELGTIAPGKRADLVVIDGDPLDFVGLRDRVAGVWKDGQHVAGVVGAGAAA
ncbi:MAG TPA: amidohydrolase family protein [Nitriliruptorales bacterium]